jgi:hypothetical protein
MKAYGGGSEFVGSRSSTRTRWRWGVSFTPWPLNHRYTLDRKLGGSQIRSGQYGENSFPYRDWNIPWVVQPIASSYTDCALPVPKKFFSIIFKYSLRTSLETQLLRYREQSIKKKMAGYSENFFKHIYTIREQNIYLSVLNQVVHYCYYYYYCALEG